MRAVTTEDAVRRHRMSELVIGLETTLADAERTDAAVRQMFSMLPPLTRARFHLRLAWNARFDWAVRLYCRATRWVFDIDKS